MEECQAIDECTSYISQPGHIGTSSNNSSAGKRRGWVGGILTRGQQCFGRISHKGTMLK